MQPFTIHWSRVQRPNDAAALFALWPSPVNPDVCFQKAGFTDFGDGDENWDTDADGLLTRLLEVLSGYGLPRQMSKPAEKHLPWYRRPFSKPEVFDFREQIELPLSWDDMPDCVVDFGASGISLRTGRGHHIFWITIPDSQATSFPSIVARVAATHPIVQTDLKWEYLV
jgi:hypothetical protein